MRKAVVVGLAGVAVVAAAAWFLRPARTPAPERAAPTPASVTQQTAATACRTIAAPQFTWRLPHESGLVGTLLACNARAGDLAAALGGADYILLGENHDNSDHHRAQALLIGLAGPRKPSVVMEQITAAQAPALEELYRDAENYPPKSAALGEALGFEDRGWPEWPIYDPIAEATHKLGGRLMAGDASPDVYRTIGKQGLAALADGEPVRLGLDRPLASPLGAALTGELKEDHCNLLPDAAIPRMQLVQRVRDAMLADAMIRVGVSPVILIAGNGHARADRGVPWYLRLRKPEQRIVSVALIEVERGAAEAGALVPRSPDGEAAADFVWLTPRAERGDPCESLRQQMQKSRAPSPAQ